MDESASARLDRLRLMIEQALEDSGLNEPAPADYRAMALSAARVLFHRVVADPERDIAVHDVLYDPWTGVLYANAHVAVATRAEYVVIDFKRPEDL